MQEQLPQTPDGLTYTCRQLRWLESYERLRQYKETYGDCDVLNRWDDGKKPLLGNWVADQRKNYRKQKLSNDRIEMLETIGFEWTVRRGRKSGHRTQMKTLRRLTLFDPRNNRNQRSDQRSDEGRRMNTLHCLPPSAPPAIQSQSHSERILSLELQLGKVPCVYDPSPNMPLLYRIKNLEYNLIGKESSNSGTFHERIHDLEKLL